MKRLNVGCGAYLLEGYINIDIVLPCDFQVDFFDYIIVYENYFNEIRADHWLEHQSIELAQRALEKIHHALKPGGLARIEVPDMELILQGQSGPTDVMHAIYGSQEHAGAFHKSGFTQGSLHAALVAAGFSAVAVAAFISDHPMRGGFPCLLAEARK